MIRFFIPSIGVNDLKIFEVQVVSIIADYNEVSITGKIGNDIIDAVSLTTAILYFNTLKLNINLFDKKIHFHFTDGSFIKDGSSAGLGIFLSLLNSIEYFHSCKEYNILVTGEVDLFGNICPVGGINKKIKLLNVYDFDYFIMPASNFLEIDSKFENKINKIIKSDNLNNLLSQLREVI